VKGSWAFVGRVAQGKKEKKRKKKEKIDGLRQEA
jgi:hypothetical protein